MMKMKMKQIFRVLLIAVLVFGLSACQLSRPSIGVTAYPVQYLVRRIAQDKVDIHMLSQSGTMSRAQIVENYQTVIPKLNVAFYFGKMEPYFEVYLEDFLAEKIQMVDLTLTAGVYQFQRYTVNTINGNQVITQGSYYSGSAFNRIDLLETDPYLWLDPITTISMATTIRDWLIEHYPEEKALFNANYDILKLELARMDADYQELWKQDISFVSVTPSFGNWQKSYGIQVYPLILSRYGALPSPEQLELIKARIIADDVKYIVHEPYLSEDMEALFNEIKDELELEVIELHPLSFLTDADREANKNYITLMFENLNTLENLQP